LVTRKIPLRMANDLARKFFNAAGHCSPSENTTGDSALADVLLIDDMHLVRGAVKAILTRAGHTVTEAASAEAGIAQLQKQRFDLVVTDMIMPDQDGSDVMSFLDTMGQRPPILAISGGSSDISAEEALQLARKRADAAMPKPFDNRELVATVDKLLGTVRN
jgi:CheY-like chemotaxis protein